MKTFALPSVLLLAAAHALEAQNLLSYHPAGAAGSFAFEHPLPSPAFGAGGPAVAVGAIAAPARPFQPPPFGSIAVDDTTGVVYTTNGFGSIQRSWYARLGCVPPVAPLAALPIPAAVGSVLGMAVDPVTKHLFVNNGVTVFRLNPLAGMAIVGSFATAPVANLTDLEFDAALPGVLRGVTRGGAIVEYAIGGGLLASLAPSYAAPAGSMAVGLALDRTSAIGAPHFFVLWSNGQVFNQNSGAVHTAGLVNHCGLTFIASPQNLPSGGAIGGLVPQIRVASLAVPGIVPIEIGNAPIGTFAAIFLQVGGYGPAMPLGAAGTFWLGGALPPVVVATPAGTGSYAIVLPGGVVGYSIYAQWLADAAAYPAGGAFTDAIQIEVAH